MATQIKFKRGTRANLNTLAAGGYLIPGEPIYITDEDRIAICTTDQTYETFAKESEVGGSGTTNHTSLTNLTWTSSGHTGTANKLAGFDSSGNPIYYDSFPFYVPPRIENTSGSVTLYNQTRRSWTLLDKTNLART